MKICPKCNTEHSKQGKFCSRKCANSRVFTQETNSKKSVAAKQHYFALSASEKNKRIQHLREVAPIPQGPYTKVKLLHCSHCGKQFWSNNINTVRFTSTCSDECFLSVKRKNRAGNKTKYNTEMYDSNWEVVIAKWFDENNIQYIRPKQSIPWIDSTGKQRKYFPDFYVPSMDLYVDPKNKFCIKDQQEKLDYVSQKINLIYGEVDCLKKIILSKLI